MKNMEVEANLVEDFKQIPRESAEFDKKCSKIALDIKSGQLTIVELVEHLGGLLVDLAPNNRALGTWILTQVLEGLPPNHFDGKQLQFICTFYADRLKDHHQVIPAVLRGVLALAKFAKFPEGAASQILGALFQNVSCQQQQQNDRLSIYKIFEILLEVASLELSKMGLDFVYGVINAVDGERDPKNLIFLFKWFPKFLKKIKLGHLAEETFEILACYFPVDFKAPPQDPNTITRDALAEALAPCLTAIPEFSEFCFPLALEKLDASLEIAKIDALNLLEIGCLTFNSATYAQHATEIWSQIQKELFNGPKPEIEEACHKALGALIEKISPDPALTTTVKDISDTVKRNLLPDSRLFRPSWKLLLTVARASRDSCCLVTKEIAPILINTFNITSTPSHKVAVLTVMVAFFDCYVKLFETIEFEELRNVPVLCVRAIIDDDNDLRQVGYECLTQIAKFLTVEVRLSIYENMKKLLLIKQVEGVRVAMLNCFDALARNFPAETKEKVIDMVEISNTQDLQLFLDAIIVIAYQDYFTQPVIDIFLNYLQKERVVINSLRNLIEKHEDNKEINSALFQKNVINVIVDWCIEYGDNLDEQTSENVMFVLKSIIGVQTSDTQRDILEKQLKKISNVSEQSRLILLDGILNRLHKDVEIDYNILYYLTDIASKSQHFQKDISVQLIANLINKCSIENVIQNYLDQMKQNLNDITLLAWLTKSLVMRNHEKANFLTDKLLEMLAVDEHAATAFRIIVNDSFDSLSRKSHCNRMLLYQQRFFIIASNKLSENYKPEFKSYLLAFGYLLEHTPKQAILLQFQKVFKLMILCLDECRESEILLVILRIIREFLINKEKCIEDHFYEFLMRLLNLANFEKSMQVRILAIKCLQDYTSSFPVYKLLPYKTEVLKVLGKVIDDKKRIVRREAVDARSLWFLLDAPM